MPDAHLVVPCCACKHKKSGAVPRRGATASSAPLQTRVHLITDVWLLERVVEGGGWGDKRTTQVSMMDVDIFGAITGVMSTANDARRKAGEGRGREHHDVFGDVPSSRN